MDNRYINEEEVKMKKKEKKTERNWVVNDCTCTLRATKRNLVSLLMKLDNLVLVLQWMKFCVDVHGPVYQCSRITYLFGF